MFHLIDIVDVKPEKNYRLELQFKNGEHKLFDMSPLVEKQPFKSLKDEKIFQTAHVEYGTVVWNNGFDIDPDILYERSVHI